MPFKRAIRTRGTHIRARVVYIIIYIGIKIITRRSGHSVRMRARFDSWIILSLLQFDAVPTWKTIVAMLPGCITRRMRRAKIAELKHAAARPYVFHLSTGRFDRNPPRGSRPDSTRLRFCRILRISVDYRWYCRGGPNGGAGTPGSDRRDGRIDERTVRCGGGYYLRRRRFSPEKRGRVPESATRIITTELRNTIASPECTTKAHPEFF